MSIFIRTSAYTFAAVAEMVDEIETTGYDVHTVTLLLNGQHGEFDLRIEATDSDMENHTWTGIAHRSGGVDILTND